MNTFVADPHWRGWIVGYFFLGGIAAGAYSMAALIELAGSARDRGLAKVSYYLAFPLIAVCGVLLVLDLDQPLRFWHMLIQSETGRPMFKHWSPMSIGSWALLLFGAFSAASFAAALGEDGRLGPGRWSRWAARLHHGPLGAAFQIAGALVGFFVASYTGALLTATNQPIWSDSVWIAALFLASAASTGIAAMLLLTPRRTDVPPDALDKLLWADRWILLLELAVLAALIVSLGSLAWPLLRSSAGLVLAVGTAGFGLFVPLVLHFKPLLLGRRSPLVACVLVLAGGLLLRYGVLAAAPTMLYTAGDRAIRPQDASDVPPTAVIRSPEDGRARGGGPGADTGNRPAEVRPPSKLYGTREAT